MNTFNNEPEELDAETRAIVRAAAGLPELTPSRDLWSGIEARIQAPVIALPTQHEQVAAAQRPAALPWRRMALAASLLVAVTAGVTYTLVKRSSAPPDHLAAGPTNIDSSLAVAPVAVAPVEAVSMKATEQTFDREIGAMRKIIDDRRKDLDTATIAVLEKNLKLIDAAISESKAALAKDPASAFLMDRLTHAYDTKLQLLRGVANIPSHG